MKELKEYLLIKKDYIERQLSKEPKSSKNIEEAERYGFLTGQLSAIKGCLNFFETGEK
jgi:hypothetical protein